MKKIVEWTLAFGLLTSASVLILSPVSAETQTALAAMVDRGDRAVMLEEKEVQTAGQKITNRLFGKRWICAVNQEQYGVVSDHFETKETSVRVGHRDIPLIQLAKEDVSLKDLRNVLRGEDVRDCILIQTRSWFFLILTNTVS